MTNYRRARLILQLTQVALIIILLAAVWTSGHIALWQEALATLLAIVLLSRHHLRMERK